MNASSAIRTPWSGSTSPASSSRASALVAITLIIPFGVFMRYVMNNPQSWPEPAAVLLMVMFSFLGGAAVYRATCTSRARCCSTR